MSAGRNILALVPDAFGGRGGIAQYNRDFLTALAGTSAIDCIDILPRNVQDAFTLPEKMMQSPHASNRIAYALRAVRKAFGRKIDVVFCGHINLAPLATMVAWLSRARLVVQLHGVEAWQMPRKAHRRAIEAADLVLCVSRFTRGRLLQWAAIEPERVLVLPNTVNPVFAPGDGSHLRGQWGLDGKKVLLTVARMDSRERYKGHERVITSLSSLGPEVVYVVLGEGDDLARLQDVAARAGVSDRVLFKGAADLATLVEAYRMADFYVMPSTGEGFGIAFLEAMASGTPALGLAVGGAIDALCDGELGAATTEEEFQGALLQSLGRPKVGQAIMADAVHNRFGKAMFSRNVNLTMERLFEYA